MYCSECGANVHGKFCANCGAALSPAPPVPVSSEALAEMVNYEMIVRAPEVRALVARAATESKQPTSGEEFLRFCDKAFVPLAGVSLDKIASIAHPVYAALGIRTGKENVRILKRPPGNVIVALLCSLARRGRALQQVRQGEDGCLFEATLPSDVWSFAGQLLVEVRREGTGTAVEARTVIKGQLFDWGKSNRCLSELFTDLEMTPV